MDYDRALSARCFIRIHLLLKELNALPSEESPMTSLAFVVLSYGTRYVLLEFIHLK